MFPILAIDSAFGRYDAAVIGANGIRLAQSSRAQSRGMGEPLAELIGAVLGESQLQIGDMAAIAAVSGPGSFTGIRVAMAAALGLGAAKNIPVFGVPTHAAMAMLAPVGSYDWRWVITTSGKGDYYTLLCRGDGFMQTDIEIQSDAVLPADLSGGGIIICPAGKFSFSKDCCELPMDANLAVGAGIYLQTFWQFRDRLTPTAHYMRGADVTMASS